MVVDLVDYKGRVNLLEYIKFLDKYGRFNVVYLKEGVVFERGKYSIKYDPSLEFRCTIFETTGERKKERVVGVKTIDLARYYVYDFLKEL